MAETKLDWMKTKPAELEKIVVDLAKQGETPAKIGIILRDKHGIPKAKLLGKKITKILKDNKLPVKNEKESVQDKIKNLEGHIAKNKKDNSAKKALTKDLWILRKLGNQE